MSLDTSPWRKWVYTSPWRKWVYTLPWRRWGWSVPRCREWPVTGPRQTRRCGQTLETWTNLESRDTWSMSRGTWETEMIKLFKTKLPIFLCMLYPSIVRSHNPANFDVSTIHIRNKPAVITNSPAALWLVYSVYSIQNLNNCTGQLKLGPGLGFIYKVFTKFCIHDILSLFLYSHNYIYRV